MRCENSHQKRIGQTKGPISSASAALHAHSGQIKLCLATIPGPLLLLPLTVPSEQDEITGGEAAGLLGVTRQQVNRLAHEGKLLARHVAGHFWVFKRGDVEACRVKEKSKGGRPKKTVTSMQPK
jgi:excisionase family DNA binding protein